MATSKRPTFRKNDRVTLSPIKRMIPAYDGKPHVLRDTVLTFSHLTGKGSTRNPWFVVVTDGAHFWTLEPGDIMHAEGDRAAHSTMKTRHHTTKKSPAQLNREIADVLAKDYRVLVRVEGAPKPVHVSPWMTKAHAEHAAKNHKAMVRDRGWTHVVEIEDTSGAVTRLR